MGGPGGRPLRRWALSGAVAIALAGACSSWVAGAEASDAGRAHSARAGAQAVAATGLTTSRTTVASGRTVTLRGSRWPCSATVRLTAYVNGVSPYGTAPIGGAAVGNGAFSTRWRVPHVIDSLAWTVQGVQTCGRRTHVVRRQVYITAGTSTAGTSTAGTSTAGTSTAASARAGRTPIKGGISNGATTLDQAGLQLIADEEGYKLGKNGLYIIYNDKLGFCTAGYGHLVHGKSPCVAADYSGKYNNLTAARAVALLRQDADGMAAYIVSKTKVALSQEQLDALVSFVFNVGKDAYRTSTLLKLLNGGRYDQVPAQLGRWVHGSVGNGAKRHSESLKGLVNRRAVEARLWSTGIFPPVKHPLPGGSGITTTTTTTTTTTCPTGEQPGGGGECVVVTACPDEATLDALGADGGSIPLPSGCVIGLTQPVEVKGGVTLSLTYSGSSSTEPQIYFSGSGEDGQLFHVDAGATLELTGIKLWGALLQGGAGDPGDFSANADSGTAGTDGNPGQNPGDNGQNGTDGTTADSASPGGDGTDGATNQGGAIYNAGMLEISDCWFWANSVHGGVGGAGGDGGNGGDGGRGGNGGDGAGGQNGVNNGDAGTSGGKGGDGGLAGDGGDGGDGGKGGNGGDGQGGAIYNAGSGVLSITGSMFSQNGAAGANGGQGGNAGTGGSGGAGGSGGLGGGGGNGNGAAGGNGGSGGVAQNGGSGGTGGTGGDAGDAGSGYGGAVYNDGGTLTIDSTSFSQNQAVGGIPGLGGSSAGGGGGNGAYGGDGAGGGNGGNPGVGGTGTPAGTGGTGGHAGNGGNGGDAGLGGDSGSSGDAEGGAIYSTVAITLDGVTVSASANAGSDFSGDAVTAGVYDYQCDQTYPNYKDCPGFGGIGGALGLAGAPGLPGGASGTNGIVGGDAADGTVPLMQGEASDPDIHIG